MTGSASDPQEWQRHIGNKARRDQLANLPAVRRGDVAQLVAERGGLRITAPGEVKQDARRGESVRVVNRASQKELIGRVVDGSTIEVTF